jgi:hypothetical protein
MAEFTAQVMYNFTGESETELSIRQNKEIEKSVKSILESVSISVSISTARTSAVETLKTLKANVADPDPDFFLFLFPFWKRVN